MIRPAFRRAIPITQDRPTMLQGCGGGCTGCAGRCSGSDRNSSMGGIQLPDFVPDFLQGLSWEMWALIAAAAYILIREYFFSDPKKERRRKIREAGEAYSKRVQQIRKGAAA
jgi:hypothetical protein